MELEWTNLYRVLNFFADRFIELARAHLVENNSIATRNLYNSFNKIIEIGDERLSVKIELADYWQYVEEGTGPAHKPDARSQYYPKIAPLIEWVNVKPGLPQVDGFAYAVREKIHREGIEPRPFFEPAKEQALAEFEDAIDEAVEQDISEWIEKILNDGLTRAFGK